MNIKASKLDWAPSNLCMHRPNKSSERSHFSMRALAAACVHARRSLTVGDGWRLPARPPSVVKAFLTTAIRFPERFVEARQLSVPESGPCSGTLAACGPPPTAASQARQPAITRRTLAAFTHRYDDRAAATDGTVHLIAEIVIGLHHSSPDDAGRITVARVTWSIPRDDRHAP